MLQLQYSVNITYMHWKIKKNLWDSPSGDVHFIAVVWNQTHNISEVCLYWWRGWGFPGGSVDKKSTCNDRRLGFDFLVGKIPWRKAWQPTPVFLQGESHGQRILARCSLWGYRVRCSWACTHEGKRHGLFLSGKGNAVFSSVSILFVHSCFYL